MKNIISNDFLNGLEENKKDSNYDRAEEFFKKLKSQDEANNWCFECHFPETDWVSLTYSVFICETCSGYHRGLGVHLSFVRSINMDKWSDSQMAMMSQGGNSKASEFFKKFGIPELSSIKKKYSTQTAKNYKEKILKCSKNEPWEEPTLFQEEGPFHEIWDDWVILYNKENISASTNNTLKDEMFLDWDTWIRSNNQSSRCC